MTDLERGLDAKHHQDLHHHEDLDAIKSGGSAYQSDDFRDFVVDPVAEAKLVRKIDLHMLPMLWVMYIMNYLDRTNVGNAKVGGKAGGMEKDFNMSSSDYSLVLSIFFVGYLLWEVPSNMMLARSTPRIFLPTIMLIWGSMSVGAKGIHSTGGMAAFRFVLGLVEAGFFPGVMLLMSCWYKPAEMSKRVALFYTASITAGAFGGLLAGGIIDGMEGLGGTRGWKWLFIIEGLATVVFAVAAFFILPNYPATTSWLSEEEKRLAIGRLAPAAGTTEEPHMSHWDAFKASWKDPKTWVFTLCYNVINGAGTISYFIPTLMTVLGYKGRTAQFMTVPVYGVSLVISVIGGFIADKTGQKAYVTMAAGTLSCISFILCATVPNAKVKYAFICFGGAGIWTAVPVFLSWVVTMFDGREKRAVSIATINGFGNIASVYGSFLWNKKNAPKYTPGFSTTTALCGMIVIVAAFAKWKWNDRGIAKRS